jgi:hypothetical protein
MTPKQTVQVCLFLLIGIFAVASTVWCQRLVPIRLAYALATLTNAPIWIGADLGIFKKHGFEGEGSLILDERTSTVVVDPRKSGWTAWKT